MSLILTLQFSSTGALSNHYFGFTDSIFLFWFTPTALTNLVSNCNNLPFSVDIIL